MILDVNFSLLANLFCDYTFLICCGCYLFGVILHYSIKYLWRKSWTHQMMLISRKLDSRSMVCFPGLFPEKNALGRHLSITC